LAHHEHSPYVIGAHDHHISLTGPRTPRPLDPRHRIDLDLTFEEEPLKEPVDRAMDRADGRSLPTPPIIEKRSAVVRRDLADVDVRPISLQQINEFAQMTTVGVERPVLTTRARELAQP
jgi:hypothetical protein